MGIPWCLADIDGAIQRHGKLHDPESTSTTVLDDYWRPLLTDGVV